LVAAAAGMSRALMRRNFPTPSSAARTLGAPVLAVIPREAAAAPATRTVRPAPALRVVEGKL
jgi:hypothetical protein